MEGGVKMSLSPEGKGKESRGRKKKKEITCTGYRKEEKKMSGAREGLNMDRIRRINQNDLLQVVFWGAPPL